MYASEAANMLSRDIISHIANGITDGIDHIVKVIELGQKIAIHTCPQRFCASRWSFEGLQRFNRRKYNTELVSLLLGPRQKLRHDNAKVSF